ncbi:MAG: pyridoxal-5-phosphate-dependent protein subunit beta, partial [Anaerolineaceae bacterium]
STDHLEDLTYADQRRVHNLKYYTWVEQQGKTYEEINSQWYDRNYWSGVQTQAAEIDALIEEFNARTGLAKE